MKGVLSILLFICAGTVVNAQSVVKVKLADNRPINVSVDGRYFNKTGTSVTVGDLPRGRHMLKIYAKSQTPRGRVYEELVYEGRVNTYQGMITFFSYDPYTGERTTKDQYLRDYNQPNPPSNSGNQGYNSPGYSGSETQQATAPGNNNAAQDNNYSEPASPVASPAASDLPGTLTDSKKGKLKTKIAAKNVDTEKMNTLKEALKDETFTAVQVGDMMGWFNFESSKVEFAEWAYSKTVDKDQYAVLEYKLSTQSYKDELNQFIKAQP